MILKKPCRRGPKPRKRIRRKVAPRAFRKGPKAAAKRLTKAEWSRTVRAKFDGLCVYHDRAHEATDAAHIVPVGVRPALRFHPGNGLPLCRRAHQWFTPRPVEWDFWVRSFITPEWYFSLKNAKRETA